MSFFSSFTKKNKSSSSTPKKDSNNLLSKMVDQDLVLQEKLEKLEKEKNQKKFALLEEEKYLKQCEDNKFRQHQNKNSDKLIQFLLTDEENTNQLVNSIQKENLKKQEKLLIYLKEVEKASAELINITLQFNQSFKMDFDEKYSKCDLTKHIANDNKFKIKKDNYDSLLKIEQIIEETNIQRCVLVHKASNDYSIEMEKLTNLLNTSNCYRQVLKEHLKSMYNQLKYLTGAELQRQSFQLNKNINNFSNERVTITQLLVDLIDKKKLNQKRLIQKLESQNFDFEVTNIWLSQYSKLVNDIPSELTFSEKTINPMLLHRVCTAGGDHLLLFILENELKLPLTKEYLVEMGVHNRDDQEILIKILNTIPEPSAPPEFEFSPSAPYLDELECIVCMETQFDALFIPCGHLCCCWKCSEKIISCPMCRTDISKKISITNVT